MKMLSEDRLGRMVEDCKFMIREDGHEGVGTFSDLHAVADANEYPAEAIEAEGANDPDFTAWLAEWDNFIETCNAITERLDQWLRATDKEEGR